MTHTAEVLADTPRSSSARSSQEATPVMASRTKIRHMSGPDAHAEQKVMSPPAKAIHAGQLCTSPPGSGHPRKPSWQTPNTSASNAPVERNRRATGRYAVATMPMAINTGGANTPQRISRWSIMNYSCDKTAHHPGMMRSRFPSRAGNLPDILNIHFLMPSVEKVTVTSSPTASIILVIPKSLRLMVNVLSKPMR